MACEFCRRSNPPSLQTHPCGLSQCSDEDLMGLVKNECKVSFDVLFERHYRPLARFMASVCYAEADDLVQNAFARLIQHKEKFDPTRGPFRAWLWGIARNEAYTLFRKTRRFLKSIALPSDASDRTSTGFGAESDFVLQQCVEKLPKPQQEVIALTFYVGLTNVEAGKYLGIAEGTVLSRKHNAILNLKRMYKKRENRTSRGDGSEPLPNTDP